MQYSDVANDISDFDYATTGFHTYSNETNLVTMATDIDDKVGTVLPSYYFTAAIHGPVGTEGSQTQSYTRDKINDVLYIAHTWNDSTDHSTNPVFTQRTDGHTYMDQPTGSAPNSMNNKYHAFKVAEDYAW